MQKFSSNCVLSTAGGTNSRRFRTDRVVRVLSRQNPTQKRAIESDAIGYRGKLCMRAIAVKLRRPHGSRNSSKERTVRDRLYVRAKAQSASSVYSWS